MDGGVGPEWSGGAGEAPGSVAELCRIDPARCMTRGHASGTTGPLWANPRFVCWGGLTPILEFEPGNEEGIGPGVGNTCGDTTNQSGAIERHKSVYKI